MTETATVSELLARLDQSLAQAFPSPVWVSGEIAEMRRTNRGAAYLRLADPETPENSIEVTARGRVMLEVDRALERAGVGGLRPGVEVRVQGVVGLRRGRSVVQLSLLEVDPAFTAGRLAMSREQLLARLAADGTLSANGRLPLPPVPLRIGLVTSRGSAAHADFLDHLRRPGYRFSVLTVETMMQGEHSAAQVVRALRRLASAPVDVVALVRGGGAKLDLAAFDTEEVVRAIAGMPVPVVTGIGHEIDRTLADAAAAVALNTPTAVAEWIVATVADYAGRIDTARRMIRDQARVAEKSAWSDLERIASQLGESRLVLARHGDHLDHLADSVASAARRAIDREREQLDGLAETMEAMGVEPTLRRGFAVVTRPDGTVVTRTASLRAGERLVLRMSDGSVRVVVEEEA